MPKMRPFARQLIFCFVSLRLWKDLNVCFRLREVCCSNTDNSSNTTIYTSYIYDVHMGRYRHSPLEDIPQAADTFSIFTHKDNSVHKFVQMLTSQSFTLHSTLPPFPF